MTERAHKALSFLEKKILVAYFRLKGPPRILRYSDELNKELLVLFGAAIGERDTHVYSPLVIHGGDEGYHNLEIADGCVLEGGNYLDLSAKIIIGQGATIGSGVTIMTHNNYNYNTLQEALLPHTCGIGEVRIGREAHVGARAIVLMGMTIGEQAVVRGGSVVNRDVPSRGTVGGVPARAIPGQTPS